MFLVFAILICSVALALSRRALTAKTSIEAFRPSQAFSMAFGLYFGLGGLLAYPLDSYYLLTGYVRDNYAFAAGYALVALCSFLATAAVTDAPRASREPASYRGAWPRYCAIWLASGVLMVTWSVRWWLASHGLVIKGTFSIDLAASTWMRAAIVAGNDLGFLLAILLGIASATGPFWTAFAVLAGLAELSYAALTVNRTQALVFIVLALSARALVRPTYGSRRVRLRALAIAVPGLVAVFFVGQAVRTAISKDVGAFISQDFPRARALLWESLIQPEIPKGDETFYANRLNPYDFFASVVHAVDEAGIRPLHGRTFAVYLPQAIPRALWPAKPNPDLDAEGSIEEAFGLPLVDTMVTPVAELFANFHLLGVVVGYALLGLCYGLLYRLMFGRGNRFSEWQVLIYLLVLVPLCWMENTLSDGYLTRFRNMAALVAIIWFLAALFAQMERMLKRVQQHRNPASQVPARTGTSSAGDRTWWR